MFIKSVIQKAYHSDVKYHMTLKSYLVYILQACVASPTKRASIMSFPLFAIEWTGQSATEDHLVSTSLWPQLCAKTFNN